MRAVQAPSPEGQEGLEKTTVTPFPGFGAAEGDDENWGGETLCPDGKVGAHGLAQSLSPGSESLSLCGLDWVR